MVTQVVTDTNDSPPSRPPSSPEKPTSAHPDFIVMKMQKTQHVPGLGYCKYYYMSIKTNSVTYVPPPPPILHRIDKENDDQEENILDCGTGLDNFFVKVPNQDSFFTKKFWRGDNTR